MRSFFAVNLSSELFSPTKSYLSSLQEELGDCQGADSIRWVKPRNLHLTLKFLGDVPIVELSELVEAASTIARATKPFELRFHKLMRLGSSRHSVLCLGLEDSDAFIKVADALEDDLISRGFAPRERRKLTPHLTLGRVKKLSRALKERCRKLRDRALDLPVMKVESFSLMKSQLHPGGAVYSELEEFALEG